MEGDDQDDDQGLVVAVLVSMTMPTSVGSEITVIWGLGEGASDMAEPDLALIRGCLCLCLCDVMMRVILMKLTMMMLNMFTLTRGGFRDTGGWIALLLTRDLGLGGRGDKTFDFAFRIELNNCGT